MEENGHIQFLEKLTRNLEFSSLVISVDYNRFEIPGVVGKVEAFTIYKDDKISIARSYGLKGTILPFHSHKGKEWFGPIVGKVRIEFSDGEVVTLSEGEGYEIHDERSHNCTYLENTWLWLVTYPAEFPIIESEKSSIPT